MALNFDSFNPFNIIVSLLNWTIEIKKSNLLIFVMKLLANALLTVVFLGSRMSASITCDKDISLTGVGISTVLGAFQEVGQIYAANRSSLLGVKVSFSYDTVSSSYIWPRVLRTSSDNKTAIFTFTDAPSGIISELAPWVTIPLFAGWEKRIAVLKRLKVIISLIFSLF